MKKLVTALTLATLAATPAFATTYHRAHAPASPMASEPNGAYAAAPGNYGAGSGVVIEGGKVVGQDPDPNVRLQLLKDGALPNS
jgi:hypothetical protein